LYNKTKSNRGTESGILQRNKTLFYAMLDKVIACVQLSGKRLGYSSYSFLELYSRTETEEDVHQITRRHFKFVQSEVTS